MIYEEISLRKYNTFGLNVKADRLVTFMREENAIRFFKQQTGSDQNFFVLGSGSNILFTKDFHGTIIHPEIDDITLKEKKDDYVIISAGSGVVWDKLVESAVNRGLGGIENLSYIPGSAGAAAVQNIGAYGSEIRDAIVRVRAINIQDGSIREFFNEECRFGYRDSIFKGELKGRYLITRITLKLSTKPLVSLGYGSLRDEVARIGTNSLQNVRKAVLSTRQSKLPDPATLGNAGSFFKNPVVTGHYADDLKRRFPAMPSFSDPSGNVKLAAGWLVDQCGWKGKRIGDAGVYEKQALVIVNFGKATGQELFDLSENIRKSVYEKFGIILEREVEVI